MTTRLNTAMALLILGIPSWSVAAAPATAKPAPPVVRAPTTTVLLDGKPLLPTHDTAAGFWLFARDEGSQLAVFGHPPCRAVASLEKGRQIVLHVPMGKLAVQGEITLVAEHLDGSVASITLRTAKDAQPPVLVDAHHKTTLRLAVGPVAEPTEIWIELAAPAGPTSFRLDGLRRLQDNRPSPIAWQPESRIYPQTDAVASSPLVRPAIEQAMIEWDWRMQDGIGTPREPRSYAEATAATLARGEQLLAELAAQDVSVAEKKAAWKRLTERHEALSRDSAASDEARESLWLEVHRLRREILLAHPLAKVGPLVFVKHVPSTMSHQLTQYYGYTARPGGGVFVLPQPGRSMRVQKLTASLPEGSYLHPEVSYEGNQVYFAYCECPTAPRAWGDPKSLERRYHLYRMNADGSSVVRLTDGAYDDFSPRCLPDGKLLFISTRRGGFHRCGRGPCYVYSLALAEGDGSNPHAISLHETNEWDPTLLHDGRVVYTRWDYVDRNAIFYQQLWSARQDGSHVRIYFGNNTFNPAGTWETRAVPGSNLVMATAAPHHGMTAGSIILIDVSQGVDGDRPIRRLTSDVRFPETETRLMAGVPADKPTRFDDVTKGGWGPQPQAASTRMNTIPTEENRWPGHCYRSPYPLSEKVFLAAYSYDSLRGEPGVNLPNMFGLYLCDTSGNKELLYRDPNLSSQWPVPLRAHEKPPVLVMPPTVAETKSPADRAEGTLFLKNVYDSWPKLPDVPISHLRIIQVLPKTTPHANDPRVGAANASPGKQVLGTVPVERDGSAYFRVPARTPILFQALDAQGRAVQTMRSLTYLQPGEQLACAGCHERRTDAVPAVGAAMAIGRPASTIAPGPDGSHPLSYPILVQPVLDRLCVECHNAKKPETKFVLTSEPAGTFSRSYNTLVPLVSYSAWGNPNNNYEPLTSPDLFGARASKLTKVLERGHHGVSLSPSDWERLNTWMDANALFYGTFNRKDQARQLRGERIQGPDLE